MPFTRKITITTGSGASKFNPQTLQAFFQDQIFWSNQDKVPHWPGLQGNPTFFMAQAIPAGQTSTTFSPSQPNTSPPTTQVTYDYVDSLTGDTGTIVVTVMPQ